MTKRRSGAYRPAATYALLGVIGAVYAAQWLSGGTVTEWLLYWPPLTAIEPWRMLTTVFVHSTASLFHILFNGFSLYVLGTLVERLIGRGRFVTLFLLAGLGGSVAVLWGEKQTKWVLDEIALRLNPPAYPLPVSFGL